MTIGSTVEEPSTTRASPGSPLCHEGRYGIRVPVNKKVRLILGTDEESGWADMDYYFKKQPMPDFGLTPDGSYPVIHAEKGIVHIELYKTFDESDGDKSPVLSIKGGSRANMVPDSCTYILQGEAEPIQVRGISAHGSTPDKGENAIAKALKELKNRGLGNGSLDRFIADLDRLIGQDTTGEGWESNARTMCPAT